MTLTRLGTIRMALILLTSVAGLALYGLPVQAQWNTYSNSDFNWYNAHQQWSAQCNQQMDQQGRWGRNRQSDSWCANNSRFRNTRPDSQWRYDYPWDTGRPQDRGNGQGNNYNSNSYNSNSDSNWYNAHQQWLAQCNQQMDQQGRWGRNRQSDSWCANNSRFRDARPDSQWRYDHQWDNSGGRDAGNGQK
jgi:hypothetical protein